MPYRCYCVFQPGFRHGHGLFSIDRSAHKAAGAARYDVCCTDPPGGIEIAAAVKLARGKNRNLLAGMQNHYHMCAYGPAKQGGAISNTITVSLPMPNFSANA